MNRTKIAIIVGRFIKFSIKLFNRGKGEAAPGLAILKIDPNFIASRQQNIKQRIIITGTNGKTTTTHLIGKILQLQNKSIITNPHGSNLSRGIASALLADNQVDATLWETDEAAFIDIFKQTKPTHVILLNLFRDQLDRYGEVDNTVKKWQKILEKSSPITLIINGDDPNLEKIAQACKQHKIIRFGVVKSDIGKDKPEAYGDAIFCPKCHQFLQYKLSTFSHLGDYKCVCGFKRGVIDYDISLLKNKIFIKNNLISSNLLGTYSAYNLAAVISLCKQLNLDMDLVNKAISDFVPSFGRQEKIKYFDKKLNLLLIKNPTAASQNLEILENREGKLNLIIAINDNFADGRDISWLWDVNFDLISNKVNKIFVTGTRALDMALRLKYAGFDMNNVVVEPDIKKTIVLLKNAEDKEFDILPTYTAMLEIRKNLIKK